MPSTISAGTTAGTAIVVSGDTTGNLAFQTNGTTTAMTIDTSQNVGIGVAPSAWSAYKGVNVGLNTTLAGSTGASVGLLSTNAYFDGSSYKYITTDAATQYQQNTGEHIWRTATSGSAGATLTFTERMRITSGGEVCVGTTNPSGTAGAGAKIVSTTGGFTYAQVTAETSNANATAYNYYSTGAGAYRFYVGAGGTVYATSTTITGISDVRLKENIQDIDVGLDALMALRPRKFDWKEGKGKDKKGDRGWIAQEFETVFPDMIDEWKDPAPEGEEPYKAVNADLIPVLVKAIQELKAELDATKAEVAALKGVA